VTRWRRPRGWSRTPSRSSSAEGREGILVLASASPRRRELLGRLGLPFDVVPSAVAEPLPPGVPIPALAAGLARAKAQDVAARLGRGLVLAADTVVAVDGRPFGKPGSREEARAMLAALRGRAHEVVTAVVLLDAGSGREASATVVSRVVMRDYGDAEVEAYLDTAEPYDKAGAYAVQGRGGRLVERVEGCFTNVVGLPLSTTARLLRTFGLAPATAAEGPGPAPCGPR
jgi:septum formation protein